MTLFSRQGLENTTLDEITAHAHVGKGTVYRYFQNKEALFMDLIEEVLKRLFTSMRALPLQGFFASDLKEILRCYVTFFSHNRDYFHLQLKHFASSPTASRESFHRIVTDQLEMFRDPWNECLEAGILKPLPFSDVGFLILGMMNAFLLHHFLSSPDDPSESQLDLMVEVITGGIFKPSPR